MEFKDYYKILGVAPGADDAQIKSEYRKLARKYHPDLNPGDAGAEARFKELNEAHEVLADPEKRRKYDELRTYRETYGHWPGEGGAGHPGGQGFHDFGSGGATYRFYTGGDGFAEGDGADFSGFSDFFETLFGRGGGFGQGFGSKGHPFGGSEAGRGANTRGADLRSELTVSLDELYRGSERAFELNGETIRVKIPTGFPEGGTLKLAGQGQPGPGGATRGDLLLKVRATPDPRFERRGDDLRAEIPVDLYTMLLGGEVTVATPGGALQLKVPAGSQNGVTLRLRGRGMPKFTGAGGKGTPEEYGDYYAKLNVRLPERLSAEERETFLRLAGRTPVGETD